jgi:hypothetical protein
VTNWPKTFRQVCLFGFCFFFNNDQCKRKLRSWVFAFRVPKFQPRNPKNEPNENEALVLKKLTAENLKEYYEYDSSAK